MKLQLSPGAQREAGRLFSPAGVTEPLPGCLKVWA